MKICVMNLSGNVGKTTLALHLLGAFKPDSRIIAVESINSTHGEDVQGLDVEEIAAHRFREIYREVMANDDVILDVGASNVSAFMAQMNRFRGLVDELDMVVVPTVPADKQQRDTNATIAWLHQLGIPGTRIRVVLNQYDVASLHPIEHVYAQVFGYSLSDGHGKAVLDSRSVVAYSEVYELVKATGLTIRQIAEQEVDWRQLRSRGRAEGGEALDRVIDQQYIHELAMAAHSNLRLVHSRLFSGSEPPRTTRAAPVQPVD